MDSNSLAPQAKVAAGGIAGAATILIVYVLSLFGVEMDAVAASALTSVIAFAAGYIKKDTAAV